MVSFFRCYTGAAVFATMTLLSALTTAHADTLVGISNGYGNPATNLIYEIDPTNGDLTGIQQVTLAGHTVLNATALAADPLNNTLFAVLRTDDGSTTARRLVTIDYTTGVASLVGSFSNALNFSSLAFRADGTLLGVTGDGSPSNPETLFQISTVTAAPTLLFALGNGADGEVIAMHPSGLLYHSSGGSTALFESVDVNTQTVTPIGQSNTEAFAMGFSISQGAMFLSDIASDLFTVDLATGNRTLVGTMSDQLVGADNRGLVFVSPAVVPEDGTLALALPALGLVGTLLARRRRYTEGHETR